jgi:ABC-2 type transport system ATP-binding protein
LKPIIEAKNISKRFAKNVLVDLNLTLLEGQTLGLIGQNGAGKTTLIKIILGFLKPDSGHIEIFGKNRIDPAGNIGYLPEQPDYHLQFSGKEYLTLLAGISGVTEIRKRVNDVLELVGMIDRASERMSRYSKGMLQRIGLAQSILLDPPFLILDEPLSGLDPAGQKDLRDIIIELQNRGKSIFLCSHLLNEVEKICTDIAIIYEGKIISQGSINELLVFRNQFLLKVDGVTQSDLERIGAPFQVSCIDDQTCTFEVQGRGDKEALLKTLIEHGAQINELTLNKRSLEEYFILKTGGN